MDGLGTQKTNFQFGAAGVVDDEAGAAAAAGLAAAAAVMCLSG